MRLKPDLGTMVKFLAAVRPRGPHTLSAIHPERQQVTWTDAVAQGLDMARQRIHTATFDHKSMAQCRHWVERENRERNIYFSLNPTRRQAFSQKAAQYIRKAKPGRSAGKLPDILAHQYVAFDIDLPPGDKTPEQWDEYVRWKLKRTKWPFTLIWRTGGGMQAACRIKPAVLLETDDDVRAAKAINQGMAAWLAEKTKLDLDFIDNVDRILRVCGTINWPTAKKIAEGRVPCLAGPFTYDADVAYPREKLPQSKKAKARAQTVQYQNHGLSEPPGGWDHDENVPYAVLHCRHTNDLAAEGKSGTGIRTALIMRDWGMSEEMALNIMWKYWVPRCEYVWDESELKSKIATAYKLAENDPGCRTPSYRNANAQHQFEEARKEFSND